ncbi:MAG TPA: condensation domain-containing protein, partial [Blastocatellia bacterium]|nr:condensation domain-containing protein [Blastocatellia bacterium]
MKNVEDVYPLTPVQQGMLFHTMYDPASGMYVENLSWTLKGNLNVPAFEGAWQQVIDRHPILRSAFFGEGLDEPLQVVRLQVKVPLEKLDWSGLPESEKERRLSDLIKEERRRGFELARAPLMRLTLVSWDEGVHRIIWSHHHMLLDGWSVALILKEIFVLYESLTSGWTSELDAIRPYSDYIAWMQQQDRSEAERYWRKELDGFSAPTPMPADRLPGNLEDGPQDFIEQELRLPEAATSALKSMARQQQLTLNTVAQGAWALLLSRYGREEDVVFGSIVSGRPADLPGVESMVGLFLNALPVRVRAIPTEPLLQWLKRLQARQFEARGFEFSALADIQRCSSIPGGVQLFESTLAFENFPVDDLLRGQGGSLSVEDFTRHSSKSNYPINVVVQPEKELVLQISYDPRLFESSTITRMLGHFRNLLEGMVSNPTCLLSELDMTSEEERRLILQEWTETSGPFPGDTCIHEMFERQVERAPNAVAVEFEGKQWSYRELNCRANQLAHYLRQMGVRPEVRVGICIERSVEMIVAILGILKAGGVYVPLDPSYPLDRISLMIEDAGISLLVSMDVLADRIPSLWIQMVYLDSDRDLINRQPVDDPRSDVAAE